MLILGHRGAPREAPENTIAAFAEALRQGADGVELDVQRTADGVPVVIHDDGLERTTDGSGAVSALGLEHLRRFASRGQPIPTLEEAVRWAVEAGAALNVEIKARGVEEETLEVLSTAGVLESTLISSFDARTVRTVGSLAPAATRYLLTERWDEEVLRAVVESRAQGVCLRVDAASPLALDVLRAEGLPVVVWTVDEPERMRELMTAGIAALITNHPARAVQIARELGLRSG